MSNKVSIIVPCYNQDVYLDEALHSIFCQTFSNWECIIVDDGSTDGTELIAEKWCNKDERFRYFYKQNGGISSARNYGLNKANGKYIQFLDADDFIDENKLEYCLSELNNPRNKEILLAISNFKMFSVPKNIYSGPYCKLDLSLFNFYDILYKWDIEFSIPIHCGLFNIKLFEGFRFPEEIKAYEDWLMWLFLFKKELPVSFIDKPLVYYRIHKHNVTKNLQHLNENYIKAIFYLPKILSQEESLEFYKFLIARDNLKILRLSQTIENFQNSATFSVYQKYKGTYPGKILAIFLRLFQKT